MVLSCVNGRGGARGLAYQLLPNQNRFTCKATGCRKQYSNTNDTVFADHKMSYKDMLLGIRFFMKEAKGNTVISLSKDLGVTY